jgi:hypothetical protein
MQNCLSIHGFHFVINNGAHIKKKAEFTTEVHFTDIRGVDLSRLSQPPFQCILALFKHQLIVYSMPRIHCSWANFAGTL